MDIAVIDDGVCNEVFGIGELAFDIDFTGQNKKTDTRSHGTVCSAIIRKYAPRASVGSLRVIEDRGRNGSVDNLCAAIDWCVDNGIRLIHMSIGSSVIADRNRIQESVNRGLSAGCIFVSALSNKDGWSYPACFGGVIGVKNNGALHGDDFCISNHEGIDFESASIHELRRADNSTFISRSCNSYAAPVITAHVHNIAGGTRDFRVQNIKNALISRISGHTLSHKHTFIDFISQETKSRVSSDPKDGYYSIVHSRTKVGASAEDKTNSPRIYGLAYDGILNQETYVSILKKGVLLWDRSHIRRKNLNVNKEFSLPCIKIRGEIEDALGFGSKLKETLSQNQYSCLCVSNRFEGIPFGFQILEDDGEIEDISLKYDYSCILICSSYDYVSDIELSIIDGICRFDSGDKILTVNRDADVFEKVAKEIENCFETEMSDEEMKYD